MQYSFETPRFRQRNDSSPYTMFLKIKQYIQDKIFPYIPAEELNKFDFKTPGIN